MKILFICKHNRFRSKVAEAFFNFHNKENKKHKGRSRGIIKDVPSAESVVEIMRELRAKLKDKISRKVSRKDIKWADLIVVVADNVPLSMFKNKKIEIWRISDTSNKDIEAIRRRVKNIERKVLNLLGRL